MNVTSNWGINRRAVQCLKQMDNFGPQSVRMEICLLLSVADIYQWIRKLLRI